MQRFSVEITGRGATLDGVRDIYFSPDFDTAIAKATDLLERKQRTRVQQPDGREEIRTTVVPNVALPRPVGKLLQGRAIRYDEVVLYDPAVRSADFSIRSLAGRSVQVNGTVRFMQEGSDVRLRFDGEARIGLFGLGGMLERYLVSEVTSRYARAEAVLQRFIDASK